VGKTKVMISAFHLILLYLTVLKDIEKFGVLEN